MYKHVLNKKKSCSIISVLYIHPIVTGAVIVW